MLHCYSFDNARVSDGHHKSQSVKVVIEIDIEDDDPFGSPAPKGHYQNGFACKGELTFECPNDGSYSHFKKMTEMDLVIIDEKDSSKLKIVLMDNLAQLPGMPPAKEGLACRTKYYIWSFIVVKKPLCDGIGLFPESFKRSVMKVFIFTRFLGFWNSTRTSAVVTAQTRLNAIDLLNDELCEKGLAPLQEGCYSLVELDATTPLAVIVANGDD